MSRVLGLDVGDARIGVALSDEGRLIASPLTVIHSVGWGPDSREILRLMQEHGADLIVCGLPRNMDGSVGFQAEKVQRFMQVLTDQGVPVEWMDERLTTVSATRALIEGGMRRQAIIESVIRDGVERGEFSCADLTAASILFNGAVHYICMINDIGDTSIDPVPTVQLFLRSIQNNHE